MQRRAIALVLAAAWGIGTVASVCAESFTPAERLRRPVGVAVDGEGRWLFTANRNSGSVSVVDLEEKRATAEVPLGERLSDLCLAPSDGWLLATDEARHELVLLARSGGELRVAARAKVAPYPVCVVLAGQRQAWVASLWSRRLTGVRIVSGGAGEEGLRLALEPGEPVDLPFAPRCVELADDEHLVVADAFGGNLAVVEAATGDVISQRRLTGHNLRGLAVSPDGEHLLITHQSLDSYTATSRNFVHWGGVMNNLLRLVPLADLLDPERQGPPGGSSYPLGHPDSATGDPGPVLVTGRGQTVVALSGVHEVALRPTPRAPLVRREVGRRPTALAASRDGRTVFVANTYSDSVSVLNMPSMEVAAEISLGPEPELNAAGRGELLFYDARLALDGWYSCHSCHTDGHTNGLLNDNFSDGEFGAAKRVLSLRGTAETGPWAWNGKSETLAGQIEKSIRVTMQGPRVSDEEVAALAAYLETLPPVPSLERLRGTLDEEQVQRGRAVFAAQGCVDCHQPPRYTSAGRYDVGLKDETGNTRFNPPSLRGVGQRGPYFHDNRAESLREVFTKHRHQLDAELAPGDLEALLAFLRSL